MTRSVLITGSEGHLGRALRERFEALGCVVFGVDAPGTGAETECDLEGNATAWMDFEPDVVICNAKVRNWVAHEAIARRARSAIINIGSIYGVLGNDPKMYEGTEVEPTPAWYAASKGALVALTRWQACNLAPVRSNCVCPGGIFRNHSGGFNSAYSSRVPLKRMATEADVVNAVEFLADPVRAAYITGQVLMVDGGLSCMA